MEKKDLGKTSIGLEANVAALIGYVGGFVTGVIVFLLEKKNRFVRFHAMQSIVTFGGILVLQIAVSFLHFLALLAPLLSLASFVLWVLLLIKAYQGEMFKLPIAGDIADEKSRTAEPGDTFEGRAPEEK